VLKQLSIRTKMLICVGMLFLVIALLAAGGINGVYAHRDLAQAVSHRSLEIPLGDDLNSAVHQLQLYCQLALSEASESSLEPSALAGAGESDEPIAMKPAAGFRSKQSKKTDELWKFPHLLGSVRESLELYRIQLSKASPNDLSLGKTDNEARIVTELETLIDEIDSRLREESEVKGYHYWLFDPSTAMFLSDRIKKLSDLSGELPGYLHDRMTQCAVKTRGEYRARMAFVFVSTGAAAALLVLLVLFAYVWVIQPLRVLMDGARRVAVLGDFSHRIDLSSDDEMAKLAAAMNAMTSRFQEIRDDLDGQVKQRTREVVRSEQMASLGLLAAGVAHEVNNPLQSIAMMAESLRDRIEIEEEDHLHPLGDDLPVFRRYLATIVDESFRIKGITEKLLDCSRIGDASRRDTDLQEIVSDMLMMVRPLNKTKTIEYYEPMSVRARVNPQEIKQVVLNLVTNALDACDEGGRVVVRLTHSGDRALLLVSDNGCGMTEEVLEHLFEPFYTRRRDGQGTGLGLSITYRIVNEHGGTIEAFSDGPSRGSLFRVSLPLSKHEKNSTLRKQVA
jgi:two-component system, NtrC family, sensor kinase